MTGSFVPAIAQAGVMTGLFSATVFSMLREGTGGPKKENVQTMPLLQPAMNLQPTGTGGGDIEVVDNALVPQDGPLGTPVDITDAAKSSQISVYVVREGDTLSSIAQLFDVTVNTIMWANDLTRATAIRPGQQLVILPVTGIRYTVKSGGSLRDIVKKYGGDLEEAARYNGIDSDEVLAAGTTVVIPDAELQVPTVTPKKSAGVRVAAPSSSGLPTYAGYYMRPVIGGTKTQGVHGYNAVDIGIPVGSPVYASAGGEVIIVRDGGYNGGYGSYIVIRHNNGTQTLYAHLSQTNIYSGAQVSQGDLIGYTGNSGRSTGPHLHFEIRGAKNPF